MIYDTAALQSGFAVEDPKEFSGRVERFINLSLGLEHTEVPDEPEEPPKPKVEQNTEEAEHHDEL